MSQTLKSSETKSPAPRWGVARLMLLLSFALALLGAAGVSCGGASTSQAGTDTSTNWLKTCSSETDCELGSSCSCGRCTRECASDADCASFSSDAVCESTSNGCVEEMLCMPRAADLDLGSSSAASSASCTHLANDYTVGSPALCFGRELPECPPGSEAFFDACGCGCSAAPDYPRACRDQCELAGDCDSLRFDEFPDYDGTRRGWLAGATEFGTALVAGECANGGRRFLYGANGTTSEARVFTSDGLFLGLGTSTDVISPGCWGQGYWPEPVRCEMATVTEVLNAALGFGEVGQVVTLPWGDGPPEPFR